LLSSARKGHRCALSRYHKIFLTLTTAGIIGTPAAYAQSSVVLYGIVDSGYGYEQFRHQDSNRSVKATRSGLNDGYLKSNRWGLKGSEDLGRGLHAIFHLEQGFTLNTGTQKDNYAFSRKAILGLQSDTWGTLTAGRQKTLGDDFLSINTTKGMGKSKRAFGASGVRVDKLVKYITPNWNGLNAGVGYATNGNVVRDKTTGFDRPVDRDYLATAGLRYAKGPLTLAGVYDWQHANKSDGHRQRYTVRNWALAASYKFDKFKLNLAYGQDHHGKLKSPGYIGSSTFGSYTINGLGDYNSQGFKSRNTMVSVSVPVALGELGVSWTRSSSNLGDVYANNNPGQRLATQTQNIYAAMYTYKLSTRTTLYGYGSYGTGLAYIDKLKGGQAGFGLNHRF